MPVETVPIQRVCCKLVLMDRSVMSEVLDMDAILECDKEARALANEIIAA